MTHRSGNWNMGAAALAATLAAAACLLLLAAPRGADAYAGCGCAPSWTTIINGRTLGPFKSCANPDGDLWNWCFVDPLNCTADPCQGVTKGAFWDYCEKYNDTTSWLYQAEELGCQTKVLKFGKGSFADGRVAPETGFDPALIGQLGTGAGAAGGGLMMNGGASQAMPLAAPQP